MFSGKRLFWHYCLQLSFVYKTVSQISFNLFCLGDKRLLLDFIRKYGWFQGHNEHFPIYLDLRLKFQKTDTWFCRWKSTDNNDINILLSLENSCTIFLTKEKTWKCIFNINSESLQTHTEKKLWHSKTTIICYLMIYDVIYSLLVLIEKVAFSNKQL